MGSSRCTENLTKLSTKELTELYERQSKILNNKKIVDHLPDKGRQLQEKFDRVKQELQFRKNIKEVEGNMKTLTITCQTSDALKGKQVQHICSIERPPKDDRYKPFATLAKKNENTKTEKVTQFITLAESVTLLERVPVENIKKGVGSAQNAVWINEDENFFSEEEEEEEDNSRI